LDNRTRVARGQIAGTVTEEETMSEAIKYDRRRFIGTAVMATAGAGLVGSQWRGPASHDEFSPVAAKASGSGKQIIAGNLKMGYAEAGPSDGPPAILLRGGSYGIDSDVDAAPLADRGYRVIVPYVRDTKRNGRQAADASDVMALMDALKIEKALVGGFDEAARIADVMAALWPQRVKGIVPVSDYVVVNLAANQRPLPPQQELEWWYEYYFSRAQ
jgi:hypothetical protein